VNLSKGKKKKASFDNVKVKKLIEKKNHKRRRKGLPNFITFFLGKINPN